jgi:hypothetical protein
MAKLRFVDGTPEVDGTPNELAEFLKSYNLPTKIGNIDVGGRKSGSSETIIELDIPTADQIVAIIEEGGRPFTFNMIEQQIRTYGNPISSKHDRTNYESYYREFRKAQTRMEKKYGGKWDSITEKIDGIQSKRYTLIEGQINQETKTLTQPFTISESSLNEQTENENKGIQD